MIFLEHSFFLDIRAVALDWLGKTTSKRCPGHNTLIQQHASFVDNATSIPFRLAAVDGANTALARGNKQGTVLRAIETKLSSLL